MARRRAKAWYVVSTEDNAEPPRIEGIEVWVPVVRERRLVDGELATVVYPLFEGYALVGSGLPWQEIERRTGLRLLRNGCPPKPLSRAEITRIRETVESEWNREMVFERGQSVSVQCGPYTGFVARFLRQVSVRGGRYAKIVVDLYGERTQVELIPLDHLEAAR